VGGVKGQDTREMDRGRKGKADQRDAKMKGIETSLYADMDGPLFSSQLRSLNRGGQRAKKSIRAPIATRRKEWMDLVTRVRRAACRLFEGRVRIGSCVGCGSGRLSSNETSLPDFFPFSLGTR
jgi:hypothetical protein